MFLYIGSNSTVIIIIIMITILYLTSIAKEVVAHSFYPEANV